MAHIPTALLFSIRPAALLKRSSISEHGRQSWHDRMTGNSSMYRCRTWQSSAAFHCQRFRRTYNSQLAVKQFMDRGTLGLPPTWRCFRTNQIQLRFRAYDKQGSMQVNSTKASASSTTESYGTTSLRAVDAR